jgi:dUTP pyrophosphatase
MVKIKVKKIHPEATAPIYEHKGDAGMDVFSVQDLFLQPRERALIRTGLILEIPKGYEVQVRPKSGLALKDGITCLNTPGTIDSTYRGELGVILINHSSKPFFVQRGKKIAQLVVNKIETAKIQVVKEVSKTARGEGGFGSTGLDKK